MKQNQQQTTTTITQTTKVAVTKNPIKQQFHN